MNSTAAEPVFVAADEVDEGAVDALTLGRRIRDIRLSRGMTLEQLGSAIDRAPSQVSTIENGKREPRLSMLRQIAVALGTTTDELLRDEAPSERAALEIAVERAQRGPVFSALGIRPVRVSKGHSDETLRAILTLHQEVERLHRERAATPEEARRANAQLRATMRAKDNYFPELEARATELLAAVGHSGGPVSQQLVGDMANHLGFTLHYVGDLPHSTRSVTDLKNGRVYLPVESTIHDPRSALLQALGSFALGAKEPRDYADFLRQRVETNYLAAHRQALEQARHQ